MKRNLAPDKLNAINALLTNPTQKAAAEAAGISLRTLERWLADPKFQAALSEAQEQVFTHVGSGLIGLQSKAVEALADILNNPAQPGASVREKTAVDVLRLGEDYQKIAFINARISKLEEKKHYEHR
ncbi:MAG: hypothetical protein ABFD24_11080 [Anaerolineaceae bacterium]